MKTTRAVSPSTKENLAGNAPIQAGQKLVIIIGEEGHAEAKGDYPCTWWFTFKPS